LYFLLASFALSMAACEPPTEPLPPQEPGSGTGQQPLPSSELGVQPDSLGFEPEAGEKTFQVASNTHWRASCISAGGWCSVTPSSASGNGTVTVRVPQHNGYDNRSATVEVRTTDGALHKTVAVTQQAPQLLPSSALRVQPENLGFEPQAGAKTFQVVSDTHWSASCISVGGWCTVTPSFGNGHGTVTVNVSHNNGDDERYATVEVATSNGMLSRSVSVRQPPSPPELELSLSSLEFPSRAGNKALNVTSNTRWSASCESVGNWCTVTPSSASGNGTVMVSVLENNGYDERSATVTITAGALSKTVNIRQFPLPSGFDVSPSNLEFDFEADDKTFEVTSNMPWNASCASEGGWCSVTPSSGNGNATVTVGVLKNNSYDERSATVTIAAGALRRTVSLRQFPSPARLEVHPSSLEFPSRGGNKALDVTSNTRWSVSCESVGNWCTVTSSAASGNGTVMVSVLANNGYDARSATVTLTAGALRRTVEVTQPPPSPELGVSQPSLHFEFEADDKTFQVLSNTHWSASCTSSIGDWCRVMPQAGSGSAPVTVMVLANNGFDERSATVTLTAGALRRTVDVKQLPPPAELGLSASEMEFASAAGNKTFQVASNTHWSASCESEGGWCTVTPTTGSGGGSVTVSVSPNNGFDSRTATVRVRTTNGTLSRTVNVKQLPPPAELEVHPSSLEFNFEADEDTFEVFSNTYWSANCESEGDWCEVEPTSGSGGGTVVVRVSENDSDDERVALVTIAAGTLFTTVEVRQLPPPPELELSLSTLNFGFEADEDTFEVLSNTRWSASCTTSDGDNWCTVTPEAGSGDGVVSVSVSKNTGYSTRYASVEITSSSPAGTLTRWVYIAQTSPPSTLEVTPPSLDFHAGGGSKTFEVSSNTLWYAYASCINDGSCTLTPDHGVGNATVTVTVSENNSPVDRSIWVSIWTADHMHSAAVLITQPTSMPIIRSFSPEWAGAGETLTLHIANFGNNFSGLRVTLGEVEVPATGILSATATEIKVEVPQNILCTGFARVTVGSHTAISATTFSYAPKVEVSTFAGSCGQGGNRDSDDGTGSSARFWAPSGIAVDEEGNLYVADSGNNRIRKVTSEGEVSTLAGSTEGYANGLGENAQFSWPRGIAVDADGNLFVADQSNHLIRKISMPAGEVSTFAGGAGEWGYAEGIGTEARFHYPSSIAIDTEGNLYVADTHNFRIRKVTPEQEVSTFAAHMQIWLPSGITIDQENQLYVLEPWHNILKITQEEEVSIFSPATGQDIAIDTNGNLFVSDNGPRIRMVLPSGLVTTLAGSSEQSGFANGSGTEARFSGPSGIAVDADGNLYVADQWNHCIRKIEWRE